METVDYAATNVVSLPRKPEEIAADMRARLTPLLAQVGAIMDEAKSHGMAVQFQFQTDGFGRAFVPRIDVIKVL